MSYATDGFCHNAELGTYGHECGKPAVWVGTKANGFKSGFCDDCKRRGYEARGYISWEACEAPAGYAAEYRDGDGILCFGYGETRAAATKAGVDQIAGAGSMYSVMRRRIFVRALNADEASEVCELLATPW